MALAAGWLEEEPTLANSGAFCRCCQRLRRALRLAPISPWRSSWPGQNRSIEVLIKKLNPILKGWANYYRSSYHSQEVFQSIGHYVYQRWWIWARKKHRRKSKRWIYSKYVFTTPKRSWRIGASEKMFLFDMTLAKQIKVKNLKNNVKITLVFFLSLNTIIQPEFKLFNT